MQYPQRSEGGKELGVVNSPLGLEWEERGGKWLPEVGPVSDQGSLLCGTGPAHPPLLPPVPGLPRPIRVGAFYYLPER